MSEALDRRARIEELIRRLDLKYRLGVQMANLCYNVAQQDGIRPDVRESMTQLHQQWDALGPTPLLDLQAELGALKRSLLDVEHRLQQLREHIVLLSTMAVDMAKAAGDPPKERT